MIEYKAKFKVLWQFLNKNIAVLANKLRPYIIGYSGIYTAKFSQTGTANPVVTVLENTTGLSITWTRISTGSYIGTFSSPIPIDKWYLPCNAIFSGLRTVQITLGNQGGSVGYLSVYENTVSGNMVTGLIVDVTDDTYTYTDWSTICGASSLFIEFRIYN
jgi:hypothetical protein